MLRRRFIYFTANSLKTPGHTVLTRTPLSKTLCQGGDATQLVDVRAGGDEADLVAADIGDFMQDVEQFILVARSTGGGPGGVDDVG
jgi:hypothetical protein